MADYIDLDAPLVRIARRLDLADDYEALLRRKLVAAARTTKGLGLTPRQVARSAAASMPATARRRAFADVEGLLADDAIRQEAGGRVLIRRGLGRVTALDGVPI